MRSVRVAGQSHAPAALPLTKIHGTNCIRGGWAPGPVWTCAENLAPTGIRSPNHSTPIESLYRLSYRGPSL